jgi:hypothetical protein
MGAIFVELEDCFNNNITERHDSEIAFVGLLERPPTGIESNIFDRI